jgi:hypothetical protein
MRDPIQRGKRRAHRAITVTRCPAWAWGAIVRDAEADGVRGLSNAATRAMVKFALSLGAQPPEPETETEDAP